VPRHEHRVSPATKGNNVEFILWLLAVILVIAGIVAVATGGVLYGIALVAVGLLVGPGGISLFA
jgi:hypothetical protein